MIKKIWKKSTLFPISLIIAVFIAFACYFGDDEHNYPSSFFSPEITHDDKYSDFFLSPHVLYGSTAIKQDNITDFNNINITEWDGYFNHHVDTADLRSLLYSSPLSDIDALILAIKKPGNSAEKNNNSILKLKDTHSALDFLYYLGFAKRCEKYSTYRYFGWYDDSQKDTNDPKYDKEGMAALEAGGLKQITNAKSDFVKQRYVFQILRLYYKSANFQKCIQFYSDQKNVIESTNNSIKYRAMGYLAAAYYKQKEYGEADYLYSLIYDQYDTMRLTAYLSFHPQEETDWNQTLAMAKSPREKEILWQMLGIYKDPDMALEEVYALDPKSDLLDLLLARAVNVEEQSFLYQEDEFAEHDTNMSLSKIDQASVDSELVSFLKTVADKKNTAKPYEWDLAAGYLDWAKGNKTFQSYLDRAKSEWGGDSLILDEVELIDFLNLIKTGKAGDKTFEQGVLDGIGWLRGGKHAADFRQEYADDFIISNLAEKYEAIGDKVKAACFRHGLKGSDLYDDAFLKDVLTFIDKENKTPFEEYAFSESKFNRDDVLEIQALKPMYAHHFKEALAIFHEGKQAGGGGLFADPFVIHINDCHDCDAEDKNKKQYTKYTFIEKMIELEGKLKTDPSNLAETYFLLANGSYNMSYFGNAHGLYETSISAVDVYFFEFRGRDYNHSDTLPDFYNCAKAEEYYNKAMAASKDPEFKAKCCFMAAKCEQNAFYMGGGNASDYEGGKYFAMLKSTYSSTKYYQEAIKECGYFKAYLKP